MEHDYEYFKQKADEAAKYARFMDKVVLYGLLLSGGLFLAVLAVSI